MAEAGPSRLPKAAYRGHNGFTQQVRMKMSSAPRLNLHAVAANQNSASKEDRSELLNAIQRRHVVEDMMELKGMYFPGLEEIKREVLEPETSAGLKERMQEMEKKHSEEVRTLYQWHAQDYYDERLDLSRSGADFENAAVEAFYRNSTHDITTAFDEELDMHQYAHLTTLNMLMKQRDVLRTREQIEKRRRDQQFPASAAMFREIRNKDAQIRVAKFLTSDDATQDRILGEFGWSWRQVTPLINEHKQNEDFRAEIQQILRENVEVRDPRLARMPKQ